MVSSCLVLSTSGLPVGTSGLLSFSYGTVYVMVASIGASRNYFEGEIVSLEPDV